ILADNRFNRSWIDVCTPDEFHIVPSPTDATAVKIPGTTTRAGTGRHFQHHILGAIADERNETSAKRGYNALAQFLITCWLVVYRVQYLFNEVILDNMRAAGLVRTLEDHDGADLGHACRVATFRARRLFW